MRRIVITTVVRKFPASTNDNLRFPIGKSGVLVFNGVDILLVIEVSPEKEVFDMATCSL